MFRDECKLSVAAGRGGDGAASFRREKYIPKGGPDGGDGGDGGDIELLATHEVTSLLAVGRRPRYIAANGRPGGPRDRSGARGDSLVIQVPIGTLVYDSKRGNLLRDLNEDRARLVLAAGGRGGRGNAAFTTSIRQSPSSAEAGRPGEERTVRLELKLFAEVGLLGLPNAGKSTFLSATSQATPKVADYPFTTLVPHVGICAVGEFDTLVVADLPGLIEGAAGGAGLGVRFLKHVERCRLLLHLVDVGATATHDPRVAHDVIQAELERYSPELARRPRILVATKVEDEAAEARAAELERGLGVRVLCISAVTGRGLRELLDAARERVRGAAGQAEAR